MRYPLILSLLITANVQAFDPDDHAWVWSIETEVDAPAYRLVLGPDVYTHLLGDDLTELVIADSRNQPVPFAFIPRQALIEPLSRTFPLDFESNIVEDPDSETSPREPLEIELEHGQTRLTLSDSPDRDRGEGRLIFEALIAAPEPPESMPDQRILLRFASRERAEPECRLRTNGLEDERETVLTLQDEGTRQPYRYSATREIKRLPRAWHLLCFADDVPEGFELSSARLSAYGQRDHAGRHRLQPEPVADDDGYRFQTPGPMTVDAIEIASDQSNLVADVTLFSRARPDRPWRGRGQSVLSTLPDPDAGPARIELDQGTRDREWKIRIQPQPSRDPNITVTARAEELLFLAQGEGPWRLFAGSHVRSGPDAPGDMVDKTRDRLGNAWAWEVATTGEKSVSGGPDALEPPQEPVPWQRYILWSVLIVAAGLLVFLSIRVLRQD